MTTRIKTLTFLNFLIVVFCNQAFAQNTLTKEILWTTDWSPNGKFIAIGGNTDTLKIYFGRNLKPYKSLPVKNTITRVKWHPAKNIIVVTAVWQNGGFSAKLNIRFSNKH
jgi:WD40 repeat protein